jgi:hypothetical protein
MPDLVLDEVEVDCVVRFVTDIDVGVTHEHLDCLIKESAALCDRLGFDAGIHNGSKLGTGVVRVGIEIRNSHKTAEDGTTTLLKEVLNTTGTWSCHRSRTEQCHCAP